MCAGQGVGAAGCGGASSTEGAVRGILQNPRGMSEYRIVRILSAFPRAAWAFPCDAMQEW